jgi:hypothetical protein
MNKLLLTGVMLATLTTACVAQPKGFSDPYEGWRSVLSPELNLRTCPFPTCPIVMKIPRGKDVHIINIPIGGKPGWVAIEVEFQGPYQKTAYQGFVNGSYLGLPSAEW